MFSLFCAIFAHQLDTLTEYYSMENRHRKIIIALGSNTEQEAHVGLAMEMLRRHFGKMRFSRKMWTQPIGIRSDLFLNVLAEADVCMPVEEVTRRLKDIEVVCGRCQEEGESTKVEIDIDLLLYGSEKYHESDWQREYVQELLQEMA